MPEPVKLDFSKAVPIADDGAVKLDFSKAQPVEDTVTPMPAPPAKPGIFERWDKFTAPLTEIQKPDSSKKWDPSEAVKAVGNIGAGGLGMLLHPLDTLAGIGGMITAPVEMATGTPFKKTVPGELIQSFKENPYGTVEAGIGQAGATAGMGEVGEAAVGKVARGATKAAGTVGDALRSKYGPREVSIGDEKVPVTVGEANPESAAGRKQLSLKRSGAGSAKFEKVEKAQQEAAKNVIKKTAQRASGQIGPLQAEPGAVVNDAATASFAQAAPLYENLDASLKTVPDTLQNVSKLVDTAIGRARKLGVNVAEDGGDISKIHPDKDGAIQWGGSKISKASHPDRWAKLVDEGIIDESGNGTPIKAYRNVISQLKSMLRSSSDGATRHALSGEIETMTRGMDTALEGTGLEKTWHEADRLWRQGKARIDVSKAISDATKGPRAAITPHGMSEVPTEMQGGSLVKALDKLQDDGTLEDAFTPEEGKNLRQSALILDRIQKTSTGTGYGESGSRSRAIAHILRGAPGPLAGAGVGGGLGLLTGHGFIAGAEAGGFAGFIVQSIGERALVNVMTKLDGVKALNAVADAKTPAEVKSAMTKLAAVAAASAPKKTSGDLLRQAQ